MKKKFVFIIMLILAVAVCTLSFTACQVEESGGETINESVDSETSGGLVLDISGLNYSSGSDFYIYDCVDLNKVVFVNEEYAGPYAYFDIYYCGALDTTIMYTNGAFPMYTFMQTGAYDVVATAGKAGEQKFANFTMNVVAGGRPTDVQFHLEDENGNVLEKAKAGSDFYVVAELYSDGNRIVATGNNFSTRWSAANGAKSATAEKQQFYYERSKKDFSLSACLNVTCANNDKKSIVNQYTYSFDVGNNLLITDQNPQGIYWDYGSKFAGDDTIILNVGASDALGGYFAKDITLEYRYTDGYSEPLEVVYNDTEINDYQDGKAYIMVQYDGEEEFSKYSLNFIGNNTDVDGTYCKGSSSYQFNPSKTSAAIYLAYASSDESGITATTIEGSTKFIEFEKTDAEGFAVTTVSNRTATAHYSSDNQKVVLNTIMPFYSDETLQVSNNTITVRVKRQDVSNANHNFTINPTFTDIGSYGDYSYKIINPSNQVVIKKNTVVGSKSGEGESFIPVSQGTAQIKFESVNTDYCYTLTVVVEDSVMGYYLTTNGCPNYGYEIKNMNDFVIVNKAHYSGNVDSEEYNNFTALATGGELKVTSNSTDASALSARKTAYTLSLKIVAKLDSGLDFEAYGSTKFYLLPNVTVSMPFVTGEYSEFSILDELPSLNTALETNYVVTGSMNFTGYVPTVTVSASGSFDAGDITLSNGFSTSDYSVLYDSASRTFTVYSKYFTTNQGEAYGKIPILYIVVE